MLCQDDIKAWGIGQSLNGCGARGSKGGTPHGDGRSELPPNKYYTRSTAQNYPVLCRQNDPKNPQKYSADIAVLCVPPIAVVSRVSKH